MAFDLRLRVFVVFFLGVARGVVLLVDVALFDMVQGLSSRLGGIRWFYASTTGPAEAIALRALRAPSQ